MIADLLAILCFASATGIACYRIGRSRGIRAGRDLQAMFTRSIAAAAAAQRRCDDCPECQRVL